MQGVMYTRTHTRTHTMTISQPARWSFKTSKSTRAINYYEGPLYNVSIPVWENPPFAGKFYNADTIAVGTSIMKREQARGWVYIVGGDFFIHAHILDIAQVREWFNIRVVADTYLRCTLGSNYVTVEFPKTPHGAKGFLIFAHPEELHRVRSLLA